MSRRVGWLASQQACWGSTVALTPLVCYAEIATRSRANSKVAAARATSDRDERNVAQAVARHETPGRVKAIAVDRRFRGNAHASYVARSRTDSGGSGTNAMRASAPISRWSNDWGAALRKTLSGSSMR